MTTTGPTTEIGGTTDAMLRDYHDARRREDQWRIPQILLALATPLLTLLSVLFNMAHAESYGMISGAVAVVTGVGAALIGIEVWRWHRTAIGIANRFRTEHPGELGVFFKDPL